jgi:hypothetical protein
METAVYCPGKECETCSGIGEVLTDSGIRECMTCHGVGHERCTATLRDAEMKQMWDCLYQIDRTRRRDIAIVVLSWILSATALVISLVGAVSGK